MKILVCTDGSKESKKALEKAVELSGGCSINHLAVIHVYDDNSFIPGATEARYLTREDYDRFLTAQRGEGEKILAEAEEFFAEKNIEANTILRGGHPAYSIAKVANEEGYDMIIIGSRGLGGLRKLFLGSVSNAVLQEAKTSVLVVK